MKIAILAPISHPIPPINYGPWEKVVYTLAQGLTERGINTTVYASAQTEGDFNKSVTVENITEDFDPQFRFAYEMHHITRALSKISQADYDVVHNHLNWYGFLALQNISQPFISTLHGMEPAAKFIYQYYPNSKFVSISDALRKQSPDLNYLATVYNGIDFKLFQPAESQKDYLIVASRIHPGKGIHHAINLAKKTSRQLIIAGMPDDQDYFLNMIKPNIDNSQIVYYQNISQTEVRELVASAFAYVSFLEWEEPFGLSVAESIACGTPVIANNRGSMPELVKDSVSGIIVQTIDEAVERINELKSIDRKQCREYGYQKFSIEKMIDGYLKCYSMV